jgi:hypothetical protein
MSVVSIAPIEEIMRTSRESLPSWEGLPATRFGPTHRGRCDRSRLAQITQAGSSFARNGQKRRRRACIRPLLTAELSDLDAVGLGGDRSRLTWLIVNWVFPQPQVLHLPVPFPVSPHPPGGVRKGWRRDQPDGLVRRRGGRHRVHWPEGRVGAPWRANLTLNLASEPFVSKCSKS